MTHLASYFAFANETKYFCIRYFTLTENILRYNDVCAQLEYTLMHHLFKGCIADSLQNLTHMLARNPKCFFETVELYSKETGIAFVFIYSLVFLLGIPGNAMVLMVLGQKKTKNKGEMFIISLAVADFFASFFAPFTYIAFYLFPYTKWNPPQYWQDLSGIVNMSSLTVSSWSLVLIAMERRRVIVKPLHGTFSKTSKLLAIFGIWFTSFAVYTPLLLAYNGSLSMTMIALSWYTMIWTVLGWIIPLVIICVFYVDAVGSLRKQNLNALGGEAMKKRQKENKRVVVMLITIVCLFFILTLPTVLFQAIFIHINVVENILEWKTFWKLKLVQECLSIPLVLNSCINPLVYAKMHQDIHAFVKRCWQKIKCRNVPKQEASTSGISNGGFTQDTAL